MKYYINIIATSKFDGAFNATSKAREDVEKTLLSVGYIEERVYWKTFVEGESQVTRFFNKFMRPFSMSRQSSAIAKKLKPGDKAIFQYPDNSKCLSQCVKPFASRGVIVEFLIHDIPSIRYTKSISKDEVSLLNMADVLYVHTDVMKSYLKSNGVKSKMKVITLFDYYSDDLLTDDNSTNVVAFAGNLSKSIFLRKWINSNQSVNWQLHLYGLINDLDISQNTNVTYKCAFTPNHVGAVSANWGLVWDGNDFDTCSGVLGEYLKFNSSHKVSLYLTCGIPVICWSKSALAPWIIDNKLGIAVDSMSQIDERLKSISTVEYNLIKERCKIVSSKLRDGYFLKKQLEND